MPLIIKKPNEQLSQRLGNTKSNLEEVKKGATVSSPYNSPETVEEENNDNFTIVRKSSAFLRDMLAGKRNNK